MRLDGSLVTMTEAPLSFFSTGIDGDDGRGHMIHCSESL
jgi:hypothetical protein